VTGHLDPWLVLVWTFALSMLPLAAVMLTSFTKVSIVLALLRNALGVQQVPSNLALAGISLAVTLLIMAPLASRIGDRLDLDGMLSGAVRPALTDMVDAVGPPLREFMEKHVDEEELHAIGASAAKLRNEEEPSQGWSVLVPAFVVSEVASAFRIGMYLAIGFAVIDLIVANLLMAMGMTMFPPSTVATPLKLLVFVATAGFSRTIRGLIESYAG
jgi:type III secretion protein R